MPHASQGQCTSLTKPSRIKTLHTIMTDLHDTRQDRSSGGDDLATRSSISSSSTSVMTSALSPSTLEDAASSDTDSDIAKNSDDTVVKIERDTETASTSPTSLHDPTPDFLTSPVSSTESGSQAVAIPKRGRGRPRKHSDATLSPPSFKAKTFVRSKTGCLTCRKRKKKCDERKPECLNCEKNRVVCSGYPPKEEWQPGKKAHVKRLNVPSIPSSPRSVFNGLETEEDHRFFDHYSHQLSEKITINGGEPSNNPFLTLIIPMAVDNLVVMHSLLTLSGTHLLRFKPRHDWWLRKENHRSKAIELLNKAVSEAQLSNADVSDAIVICMVLQFQLKQVEGDFTGEYKVHYEGARRYIKFRDEPIGRFASEFFDFAHMAISMTSIFRPHDPHPGTEDTSHPALRFAIPCVLNTFDGIMLKVLSGLFPYITQITAIRDRIRKRRDYGVDPVTYQIIDDCHRLDENLTKWESGQEENSIDWLFAELYKEAAMIYLHRTMRKSEPEEGLRSRVRRGIVLLEHLSETGSYTSCVVLLPTFMLGCAAFYVEEREHIETAFNKLAAKNDFGNVDPSKKIVQRVWEMMDNSDDQSWDWETIKEKMNYDFPIA